MLQIHEGQCGLCAHFGQHHASAPKLVEIRTKKSAPETLIDECGHPKHAPLHLKVTPSSGCDGFTPAMVN